MSWLMGCLPGLATKGKWFQRIHSKLHLLHRTSCNSLLYGLPHLSLLSFLHCASSKKTAPPNTCWTLLRSLNGFKSANQSILKQISPECSSEGLMLKLKLQYIGHLMRRADSFEKTLMLGKIEGRGEGTTEDEMVGCLHWLNRHEFEWTPGVGDGQGGLACCSPRGHRVRHDWVTELNLCRLKMIIKLMEHMSAF